MRAFDNRASHFDNDGNFLLGRISFYDRHTSQLANIVDKDNTPIENPQMTNEIGQTIDDVFLLDNVDYSIVFDKKLDNDTYRWQYSTVDNFDVYGIDVDSKGLQVFPTISALRSANPSLIDGNTIILSGYNTEGDKPQVQYVWDSEDTTSIDNGGSIIKNPSIETGRWHLVNDFKNGLDVRHFGVFGVGTYKTTTMYYQIAAADNYAQTIGVELYFPSSSNFYLTYYELNKSDIHNATFADNTRVYSPTDSTSYIRLSNNSVNHLKIVANETFKGKYKVYGNVLKTSYTTFSGNNETLFYPTETFVFDKQYYDAVSLSDCKVIFTESNKSSVSLDNCEIVSNGKIDVRPGITFRKCHIRQSYFDNNLRTSFFSTKMSFYNCYSEIIDWTNINYYVAYCSAANVKSFDLGGQTADEDFTFSSNITIKNANLRGKTTVSGYVNIVNSIMTDVVIDSIDTYMTVTDSTINVSYTDVGNSKSLEAINSNIYVKYAQDTLSAVSAMIKNCTIDTIEVGYGSTIENSIVQDVYTYANASGLYKISFRNNTVNGNLYFKYAPDGTMNNVVTDTFITNNKIVGKFRSFIDTTNAVLAYTQGSYVVSNNENTSDNNTGVWSKYLELPVYNTEQTTTEPYVLCVENGDRSNISFPNLNVKKLLFNFNETKSNNDMIVTIELGRNGSAGTGALTILKNGISTGFTELSVGSVFRSYGKLLYSSLVQNSSVGRSQFITEGTTVLVPIYITSSVLH